MLKAIRETPRAQGLSKSKDDLRIQRERGMMKCDHGPGTDIERVRELLTLGPESAGLVKTARTVAKQIEEDKSLISCREQEDDITNETLMYRANSEQGRGRGMDRAHGRS